MSFTLRPRVNRVRAWYPPKVPIRDPIPPSSAPAIKDWPADAHRQAPDSPPITIRAINDGSAVRLGVWGSLSLTYSAIAPSENIATATADPMNDKGESCRFSQPRKAAQLTTAGAVRARSPATIPMPTARKKTEFTLMNNLAFRLLRTYAEARFGAVTCNTNLPRVWPATPRSNASLALASGIVSAMTGRIAPESINLNSKGSDPAGGPLDQHALTGRQTRVIEKGLPDRQRGKWDGRSLRVLECFWFVGQVSGADCDILRSAAIPTK